MSPKTRERTLASPLVGPLPRLLSGQPWLRCPTTRGAGPVSCSHHHRYPWRSRPLGYYPMYDTLGGYLPIRRPGPSGGACGLLIKRVEQTSSELRREVSRLAHLRHVPKVSRVLSCPRSELAIGRLGGLGTSSRRRGHPQGRREPVVRPPTVGRTRGGARGSRIRFGLGEAAEGDGGDGARLGDAPALVSRVRSRHGPRRRPSRRRPAGDSEVYWRHQGELRGAEPTAPMEPTLAPKASRE